ncbi:MAG: ABC transporter permease [Sandaracinaceae bacterium]|nr:ABC transporter permease [Sandaracinaceae bacterium]
MSGDLFYRPFVERIDENTYQEVAALESNGMLTISLAIIAFFVAYSTFLREYDEKTIDWLVSLPIRRSEIFLIKAFAGAFVIVSLVCVGQFTNYLLQALNPDSIEGKNFRLDVVFRIIFLQSVVGTIFFFHGIWASRFRLFGLLPYVLAASIIPLFEELNPSLAWLNPATILRLEYAGRIPLIPWKLIAGHTLIALLFGRSAYERWLLHSEKPPSGPKRKIVAVLATSFVFFCSCNGMLAWLLLGFFKGSLPMNDPNTRSQPKQFGVGTLQTKHLRFTYPGSFERAAFQLAKRADRIVEIQSKILGIEEIPTILVDLAEHTHFHEGITGGIRIRMGINEFSSWRLLHVFAHESAHVFQQQLSQGRFDEWPDFRPFIEGGAEWLAFESISMLYEEGNSEKWMSESEWAEEEALRRASRAVATLAWQRHQIRIEDILNVKEFEKRYDERLTYPLGETMTEAIAIACEKKGIGSMWRVFTQSDFPQNAHGVLLVRHVLQRMHCDSERWQQAHEKLLSEFANKERALLDSVPRLESKIKDITPHFVIVETHPDRPSSFPPESYALAFRSHENAKSNEVRSIRGEIIQQGDMHLVFFRIPRNHIAGKRFDFMLSLFIHPAAFPYSEPWQAALLE